MFGRAYYGLGIEFKDTSAYKWTLKFNETQKLGDLPEVIGQMQWAKTPISDESGSWRNFFIWRNFGQTRVRVIQNPVFTCSGTRDLDGDLEPFLSSGLFKDTCSF